MLQKRRFITPPPVVDPRIIVGAVVQIDPEDGEVFGACFLVVTDVKTWGVQGYVHLPGKGDAGGNAYYRVPFNKIAYIGLSEWIHVEPEAADAVDPQAASTGTPTPRDTVSSSSSTTCAPLPQEAPRP